MVLGLLLVPNGKALGRLMGDKYYDKVGVEICLKVFRFIIESQNMGWYHPYPLDWVLGLFSLAIKDTIPMWSKTIARQLHCIALYFY